MKEFQITCISKPHRFSANEHITHVGNLSDNWKLTRESVIRRINEGQESFFVLNPNTLEKTYVGIVEEI